MPDAAELVAHARETRVVVIGAAGAVVALECAKVGMAVTVLDDAGAGAPVADTVDLGGVTVDVDADGFGADVPAFTELVSELGLADRLEVLRPARTGIADLSAAAPAPVAPLPEGALLGIPPNPWDPAVRRVVGWAGTWRAYLDRVRPPLTIGRERNLAALVRSRMGDRVCDRLVAPVTRARWGLDPSDVDVEVAARGLNSALTRSGSLGGAVAEVAAQPQAGALVFDDPAAWPSALATRLGDLGGEVRTGTRVRSISREGGEWRIEVGEPAADDLADDSASSVVTADIVIVAADEARTRSLLAELVELPPAEATPPVDVVLLRVRAPSISGAAPSEVVSSREGVRRVVDLTATHPSLAAAVGDGERVLHVTLPASDADDAATVATAQAAASVALGVPLAASAVVASRRVRRDGAVPAVRLGAAEEAAALHAAVEATPGLGLAAPWISGGGRADAVADAIAEAVRLRRRVLWGDDAAGSF